MQENLVIVESPAKAKTIEKFLGKDYVVKSSFGHIRDLSKKDLGINIGEGFKPVYEIPADKKKVVDELTKLAKDKTVWLASDEDREGEAIAWHLTEVLGLPVDRTKRIVFHEITKRAILEAIEKPRTVNMDLVNAQQARRILDRLVGFELSPVLWKKVRPALSAGRVQSVAVRLIVEREREIIAFRSTPYFRVVAQFHAAGAQDLAFEEREGRVAPAGAAAVLVLDRGHGDQPDVGESVSLRLGCGGSLRCGREGGAERKGCQQEFFHRLCCLGIGVRLLLRGRDDLPALFERQRLRLGAFR